MAASHRLPVEIWHKAFDYLDNQDLKAFAISSHYTRALAVPKLFATVSVRFGRFEDHSLSGVEDGLHVWDEEREEVEVGKSLDVLLRLAVSDDDTSALALSGLVQTLRVVIVDAYHPLVFEKYHLRLALKKLVRLRHFSWIGDRLPLDIAQELCISCPGLHSLSVHGLDHESANALQSLQDLREIELIDACASSASRPGISDGYPYTAMRDILDRNRNSLERLAMSCTTLLKSITRPLGMAFRLTHLVVNEVVALPDLWIFLFQADALESLILLDVTSLWFLPFVPGTLPRLRDLKVGVDHLPNDEEMVAHANTQRGMLGLAHALLAFVRLHRNLCRFDFSLWPTRQRIDPDEELDAENGLWFSDVVQAVCELEGVQALGLSVPALHERDMQQALDWLVGRAPSIRTCSALRLGGVSNATIETVTCEVHQCLFLALSNFRPKECVSPKYPLPSIEELLFHHGVCELEQVCLGGKMFDILPSDGISEGRIDVEPWSSERLRKRTEADFYTLDAHWLMSYHTISRDTREHIDGDLGPVEVGWGL